MSRTYVCILLSCMVLASTSLGALNAYLYLESENLGIIEGGVTQSGREGSMMVIAFSHQVHVPRDASTGLPTDKRQHEPLRITKEIDRASPLLMEVLTSQDKLTRFDLGFWQPSTTGAEVKFYTIRLNNAKIVGIRQEMLNNKYEENMSHKEREHVSFVYDSIEWIYELTGISSDDSWHYAGADIPISDLTGDGRVNLLDFAIMADEWLGFPQ